MTTPISGPAATAQLADIEAVLAHTSTTPPTWAESEAANDADGRAEAKKDEREGVWMGERDLARLARERAE